MDIGSAFGACQARLACLLSNVVIDSTAGNPGFKLLQCQEEVSTSALSAAEPASKNFGFSAELTNKDKYIRIDRDIAYIADVKRSAKKYGRLT